MGVAAQVALLQAERERQAAEADALRKERLAREESARKAKEAAEAARRAALARKRWQDAIRKIMEANRKTNAAAQKWHKLVDARVARQQAESERAFKKFVEQMKEFVLTLLKVFLCLALAWFFYAGQEQMVENKIPSLGEGDVVYETFHTPALGYVEATSSPIAVVVPEPEQSTTTSQIATIGGLEVEDNWWFIALLVSGMMII